MKSMRIVAFLVGTLLLCAALPILADDHEAPSAAAAHQRNLEFVGGRAVQLAEAIPAESYGWRPMDGVRTVSEAIMHMASANYFFAGKLGAEAPAGVDVPNLEKITDKAECVKALEHSLEHLDQALAKVADASAAMEVFGRPGTVEDLLLITIGHVHEHFGQLIAYARSNKVVPPWSQPKPADG